MATFTSLSRFLGVDVPQPEPGYTRSRRGALLPVCEICGAVVAFESQRAHTEWHRDTRTG